MSKKINYIDKNTQKELNDKNLILYKTAEELFQNIENDSGIINRVKEDFSDVFLVDVEPENIKQYKKLKEIYNILKHYVSSNAAEHQNIQVMVFKLNESSLKRYKDIYEKNKPIYGNILQPFNYKYYYIVGYFGGTTGRNNQHLIKQIRENFNVKEI